MKTIDCRIQKCPHPVIETRKELLAAPGEPLTVLVGDEVARQNVSRLAASQGFSIGVSPTEGGFSLLLTPGTIGATAAAGQPAAGPTVVFVGAETMGSGNDELGRLLLRNYLMTLLDLDQAPDLLYFVNSGVKLACRGSEVREALEQLGCRGTDIAACGLCLEFLGLKEELAVGRTTNMFEIAQSLSTAGRVIRP